jgi:hypothetical protein
MRKYGMIPWTDLPFDETTTPDQYLAPIPQNLLDKGQQFLLGIGGKNSIQYHWVYQGANNVPAMKQALLQAPLCIGVHTGVDWNSYTPTDGVGSPNHSIGIFCVEDLQSFVDIQDHYLQEFKKLGLSYPIPQCLQGVVSIVPPPLAPVLPPNPTTIQEISWLSALANWLRNIFSTLQGNEKAKLCGASRSPLWDALRDSFIKGKVCAVCGGTKHLQLHHIKPFHLQPELELDPQNLIPLCEGNKNMNCHLVLGHYQNFATKFNPSVVEDAAKLSKGIHG